MPKSKKQVRPMGSPASIMARSSSSFGLKNVDSAVPSVEQNVSRGRTPVSFNLVVVVGRKPSRIALALSAGNAQHSSKVRESPWKPWPPLSVVPPGCIVLPFFNVRHMLPLLMRLEAASGANGDLSKPVMYSRNCCEASLPVWARYQTRRFGPHKALRVSVARSRVVFPACRCTVSTRVS